MKDSCRSKSSSLSSPFSLTAELVAMEAQPCDATSHFSNSASKSNIGRTFTFKIFDRDFVVSGANSAPTPGSRGPGGAAVLKSPRCR
ncbi:hypothetical protein Bhyg_01491 [Pseudolycoriella hygida]|uniref:Uncharacterized protein n=1 Tax=Pseudolycoriella hygida TaxID=35572 RepID=A0A9Q0S7F9_9DIPT|nr:hypothetical protein Bhyg_01491 [Pseudolycoriella hygida]